MPKKIPHRSRRGCLTCKHRKKKCDETRPECTRCRDGNFDCLGYDYLDTPEASTSRVVAHEAHDEALPDPLQSSSPSSHSESWMGNLPLGMERGGADVQLWGSQRHGVQIFGRPRITVPRSIEVNPLELGNMVQFIVSQYCQFSQRVVYRPLPFSLQNMVAHRVTHSPYIRWSMYIGARIVQAVVDGTSWQPYIGWINDFHHRMTNIPSTSETDNEELGTRLDALHGVCSLAYMVLNSPTSYAFYRHCAPLFLQLATRFPEVWTNDSAISISEALRSPRHEITQFIFTDTIMALVFAIPPLIRYDTTFHPKDWSRQQHTIFLYWLYGWTPALIILFAKLNSSRVSRQHGQTPMSQEEQIEIEKDLKERETFIDHTGDQHFIARLAIQEAWRHAALIYMHMGACGADSADPRVESSVQQIAQLASTVEGDDSLEAHLLIPCLIAGVAARKEKHRKVLHRKLSFQGPNIFLFRGADFVQVLDHLWHGAASGGRAVTWDDYANSRSVVLPIDT